MHQKEADTSGRVQWGRRFARGGLHGPVGGFHGGAPRGGFPGGGVRGGGRR